VRNGLYAIAEEMSVIVMRSARSPLLKEAGDLSSALTDAQGRLIAQGRDIPIHMGVMGFTVKEFLKRIPVETLRDGDVWFLNLPEVGGNHLPDVKAVRPVFFEGTLVAFAINLAHWADIGGAVPGSYVPWATECYQEAIRFPPVRLFREGNEEHDVFAIFRNNVRLSELVEMDLRALVAGCHVAEEKLIEVVQEMGVPDFRSGMRALCDSGERELRRRIEAIADGEYRTVTWTEWGDELYAVPCTLTVAGDTLVFDFTGASPQAPHFFNSKPYIVESGLGQSIAWLIAPDLPYSQGLFDPIELLCPEGTLVSSVAPAPVNCAHTRVTKVAYETGIECVRLALAASPESESSPPPAEAA